MRRPAVGSRVRAVLRIAGQDVEKYGVVLHQGRDRNGIYTQIQFDDRTVDDVHPSAVTREGRAEG